TDRTFGRCSAQSQNRSGAIISHSLITFQYALNFQSHHLQFLAYQILAPAPLH
ncbi:hypothetical protein HETIRDRAFT_331466, partial [Heterobasidion irregulare TC 32-1]